MTPAQRLENIDQDIRLALDINDQFKTDMLWLIDRVRRLEVVIRRYRNRVEFHWDEEFRRALEENLD